MRSADSGDTVKVHYTGKLADGEVFDSTVGGEPVEVTIGDGEILPGIETALIGMAAGDSKSLTLEEDAAFGAHNPRLMHEVERSRIPETIQIEVGMELQATSDSGEQVQFLVVEVADDTVTLDANHPLAGKELTFEIELVEFVG